MWIQWLCRHFLDEVHLLNGWVYNVRALSVHDQFCVTRATRSDSHHIRDASPIWEGLAPCIRGYDGHWLLVRYLGLVGSTSWSFCATCLRVQYCLSTKLARVLTSLNVLKIMVRGDTQSIPKFFLISNFCYSRIICSQAWWSTAFKYALSFDSRSLLLLRVDLPVSMLPFDNYFEILIVCEAPSARGETLNLRRLIDGKRGIRSCARHLLVVILHYLNCWRWMSLLEGPRWRRFEQDHFRINDFLHILGTNWKSIWDAGRLRNKRFIKHRLVWLWSNSLLIFYFLQVTLREWMFHSWLIVYPHHRHKVHNRLSFSEDCISFC